MPTINEILGAMAIIAVLCTLLHFGRVKTGQTTKVVFWCSDTGSRFITTVNNVHMAQLYINKINMSTVSSPLIIDQNGYTTHVLEAGVWSPVRQ